MWLRLLIPVARRQYLHRVPGGGSRRLLRRQQLGREKQRAFRARKPEPGFSLAPARTGGILCRTGRGRPMP